MSNMFDDDFDDESDEFESWNEDDGADTGKSPKFVRVPEARLSPAELSELRVDDLVKAYRAVRDQLTTDRRAYKSREAAMKTQLQIISMQLRDRGDQFGVDSFATPFGTAFRKLKEKFSIQGWDAFVEWLDRTKNFHVLQKRVSPNAVREIRDELMATVSAARATAHDESPITDEEVLPPGVTVLKEIEFAVRAPTASKYKK